MADLKVRVVLRHKRNRSEEDEILTADSPPNLLKAAKALAGKTHVICRIVARINEAEADVYVNGTGWVTRVFDSI